MNPDSYTIRVAGHLDQHWSYWLGGIDLEHDADGSTVLTLDTVDQAQLHGVFAGLRDIGATLIELRLRPSRTTASGTTRPHAVSGTASGTADRRGDHGW